MLMYLIQYYENKMGVDGLSYFLREASPGAFAGNKQLVDYTGKTIAMDASQYLYKSKSHKSRPKNQDSENIPKPSSLMRIFFCCVKLLKSGIKPLFVFDGRPPSVKLPVIKERALKKAEFAAQIPKAVETGDINKVEYLERKSVKVTADNIKNYKELLKLLGIPILLSPGEAEAQCAALVEAGLVYASATQDMDALTYGTRVVLRNLPLFPVRYPMEEVHLDKVLDRLQINLSGFVDLCVMMGCDYCKGIKNLGVSRAVELLQRFGTIENIIPELEKNKFEIPEDWKYSEARLQFLKPNIKNCQKIQPFTWGTPDHEGIITFLSTESTFDEREVRKQLNKITII